jgi:hypothetical protein
LAEPLVDVAGQFPQALSEKTPTPAPAAPPPPSVRGPIFVADRREGPDLLDVDASLQPLAELCAHRETQTPLMIGVVGPSGSGKSFALERLVASVEGLAKAARRSTGSPFASGIVTVPIDAGAISGDPASAIAAATFAALGRENGGVSYAALADEAAHASADPYQAANKALERHDDVRRRLDAERQARDDVEARRARLSETLLYETAGSRVDAYARGRRGQIEARLRRFDMAAGDSTANYKGLVRDLAGVGLGSRFGVVLNALWAYRSQRRLLLGAILLFVVAFGLSELQTGTALDWLRKFGSLFNLAADWVANHGGLIGNIVTVLVVLGALALALNIWRALFFTAMLFRGVRLLNYDIRERQRDLDAASARLNRRITALNQETEAAGRHAEAAEKRANARGATLPQRAVDPPFVAPTLAGPAAARAFLAALGKLMDGQTDRPPATSSQAPIISTRAILGPQAAQSAAQTGSAPAVAAPERLFLAFDNLDTLEPAAALAVIETAHSLLGQNFVAALACDPAILAPAAGGGASLRSRLDKLFQLTFNPRLAAAANSGRLLGRLIGVDGAPQPAERSVDGAQSVLSEPLSGAETTLLTALAPLAASTPRGVKRYLNAYRIARAAKAAPRPALALMLALGQSNDEEACAAMKRLMATQDRLVGDPEGPPALVAALRATRAAGGDVLTTADAVSAKNVAERYQLFV